MSEGTTPGRRGALGICAGPLLLPLAVGTPAKGVDVAHAIDGQGRNGLKLVSPVPRQRAVQALRPLARVLPRPPGWRRLRIAMIGQRGVPATFGGIERHVEELGARLAARGHEVTVYCRTNYTEDRPSTYRGMLLRHLPTAPTKHLDAITHSILSTTVAMTDWPDVVHYHALGPGLAAPLPRFLSDTPVVLTVHGLDNERAKWGRAARKVLNTAHWVSGHVPDATIGVSQTLADHYGLCFGRPAVYIPNGVNPPVHRDAEAITERFGLRAGSYALFVGRLVPEKAPDLLIRAWRDVPGDRRLVIAGGSSYTDDYVQTLQALAGEDPRVLMVGYVYGRLLEELYSNAAAFVLPSVVEGLPLTLLEAISYRIPVVVSDIPPHLEVIGGERAGYRVGPAGDRLGLTAALCRSLADSTSERASAATSAEGVLARYRWEHAAEVTERLYFTLLPPTGGGR